MGVAVSVFELDDAGAERSGHRQCVRHCVEVAELDDRDAGERRIRDGAPSHMGRARADDIVMAAQLGC